MRFLNERLTAKDVEALKSGRSCRNGGSRVHRDIFDTALVDQLFDEPNHSVVVAFRGYAESTPSFLGKDNKPE